MIRRSIKAFKNCLEMFIEVDGNNVEINYETMRFNFDVVFYS